MSAWSSDESPGLMWGKRKENGVWLARRSRRRLLWRNHGALYVALGRVRVRLMKPGA